MEKIIDSKITNINSISINGADYDIIGDVYYSTTEITSKALGFDEKFIGLFTGHISFHMVAHNMQIFDFLVLMPAEIQVTSANGMKISGNIMYIRNNIRINCNIAFLSFEGDVTENISS